MYPGFSPADTLRECPYTAAGALPASLRKRKYLRFRRSLPHGRCCCDHHVDTPRLFPSKNNQDLRVKTKTPRPEHGTKGSIFRVATQIDCKAIHLIISLRDKRAVLITKRFSSASSEVFFTQIIPSRSHLSRLSVRMEFTLLPSSQPKTID